MGRLIVDQIVTADGFVADADGGIGFFDAVAGFEQTDPLQLQLLENVDAMLFGADTYRMFSAYWPTADPGAEPVADFINSRPRHVVSSTLDAAPWGSFPPAIIERGDAAEVARRLCASYEHDVIVWGSLRLTHALFGADIVDHLRLRIVPVLLGDGVPVAHGLVAAKTLPLVKSQVTPGGHVTLGYDVV